MATATLSKNNRRFRLNHGTIKQMGGLVILPLAEYQKIIATAVPTYYLQGHVAEDIDTLVREGLAEHSVGKTRTISSLAELEN
jgi:hypothetical protein